MTDLAPLVLGALLAWTGAAKAFGRHTPRQVAETALSRILNSGRRASLAMRAVGAAELVVAAGLLAAPASVVPGMAAAVLGAGFVGYLGYARVTAPGASCGCSAAADTPITWRAFARAALVLAGGAAAVAANTAWWSQTGRHPLPSAAFLVVAAAVLTGLSADLDRVWLLPLRRLRLRVFGHPLTGRGGRVPLAASVELLEHSLAWQAASSIVRSSLLDHWDEGGWRILQFAGVHEGDRGARPVTVLFALDVEATVDTAPGPAVRVTVVDDRTEEVVSADLLAGSPLQRALPLVN